MSTEPHLRSIPSLKGRATYDNRFEVSSQVLAAERRTPPCAWSRPCPVHTRVRLGCGSGASWSTSPTERLWPRAERNMLRTVTGDFGSVDRTTLAQLNVALMA